MVEVITAYHTLRGPSKLPTLEVKIAREAVYAKKIMAQCTPLRVERNLGFPLTELGTIKKAPEFNLCPNYRGSLTAFEEVWAGAIDAIWQACKRSR